MNRLIEPSVRFGSEPGKYNFEENENYTLRIAPKVDDVPARKRHYSRLHSAADNTYQYEVTLSNLEANTNYHYQVYSDDEKINCSDTLTFKTHPVVGQKVPIRIWAVGDSGTANQHQADVYKAALKAIEKDNIPLSMYIHVGDMAYTDGRDDEFQERYFDVYQPTLSHVVCWPAMGNHEGATSSGKTADGPYYDAYVCPTLGEAGGVPSGTEAYYSFDYGRAHFICLDSHDLDRHKDGVMANWLKKDLAATDSDWLIAFWHHPPYTKGSHDSDIESQLIEMREQIMPIMEKHGVDLVLTGHSHVYERSMLIDKAYHTPTTNKGVILDDGNGHIHEDGAYHKGHGLNPHQGVTQIVTGHGGANVSRRGVIPLMRHTLVEHGSVLIDIVDDTLTARMIDKRGQERDQFSIVKKGKVKPKIVKNPWDPTGPTATPAGGPLPSDFIAKLEPVHYWKEGEIRYTLDGTEPTLESELYKEAIELPRDQEIVHLRSRSFNGKSVQPSISTETILKRYAAPIPHAQTLITVDGSFDDWSDWASDPLIIDSQAQMAKGANWNGVDDLSAKIRHAWNSNGIHFFITITDDDIRPSQGSFLYRYDCVQIMIDGRPLEEQTKATLTTGAYNILISQNSETDKTAIIPSNEKLTGVQSVIKPTENGYNMEVFIPFSEEAFPHQNFEKGRSLQLALNLIDRDERDGETTIKIMGWGAIISDKSYRNASLWKPIKLGK
ncbi:metallophosphoesterase [Puniceicoccaceae bacterium K14]|nr:metallophosphoesterase [Puniceicoccaceae bacterium K14]